MAKNLLKAGPVKKKRAFTPRGLDAKYLGEEPTWDGQEFLSEDELSSKIAAAYNWYNYFLDAKFAREYLMVYMIESGMSKAAMNMVGKNVDWKLNLTMCKTARMLSMGLEHEKLRASLNDHLVKLVESGMVIAEEEKKAAAAAKPKLEKNPADSIIADIEEMIDHNPDEEWSSNFYSWLKDTKQVKPAQAKAIADYYQPWVDELHLALLGKGRNGDLQLREAYEHMTKKQIQQRIAMFEGMINDCKSIITNKRKSVVRKPRKTKPKSAEKVVSKIKYQKEDTNLKIASIDPAKIIGASELWTFSTKYNVLTHYVAGEGGLSLKGTTLQNFTESSKQKKLRKPADVFPSITGSTSKAAERAFENLKTKDSNPNGRINEFTIILRAIK
jgi:hypothetical protein